uniref:RING-type E3 ubiquitin transferase n=1 Tax=Phallusia mammillata TaxID=59560 RepID=A0A6F9DLF6_9ASCI|nr:E3 ubiquitin-protein ligase MGRN1-like [Phallusia mammillata]
MGSLWSRSTDEVQQIYTNDAQTYTYPSPSGSYFGSHFFMGGKKFDTVQPEAYLFGDNADLNMLGPKPFNFPYNSPSGNEPVRALKCLVNIRKDTLRLIRVPNPMLKPEDVIQTNNEETQTVEEQPQGDPLYNLEFTFDTECPCSITVYYNAAEEMRNKVVMFVTKQKSGTMHYNTGCNQQFCATNHIINPADLHLGERPKTWDFSKIPIAIQVSAECPDNQFHGHSHITYATLDKVSDDSWTIKPIKQKQAINGVCYLIQEIYGIENKSKAPTFDGDDQNADPQDDDDDDDDDSAECVVCLSDMRDTLILPCKHLCLCSTCANQLRFQQSGCPICRQSFRALLQIRAIRRKTPASSVTGHSSSITEETEQDEVQSVDTAADGNSDEALPFEISIPPGFEVVPLISAINGPVSSSTASLSTSRDFTRASSIVSTTSSLSRPRKNKSKTTIDIENEVTSPVDASHELERRRSRGKRRSSKKKSVDKTSTEADQTASSEQTLSPDNRTDAVETTTTTTTPCSENRLSDEDSEVVSSQAATPVHQDMNSDKSEPLSSPKVPDIKDHNDAVYQNTEELGDFSNGGSTEKVDVDNQHPLSVEGDLTTVDENQVVIEQVSTRTNSQSADVVNTKV